MLVLRVTSFVALLFGLPGLSYAQTRATSADLGGLVIDQSKAVLRNATIVVTSRETNSRRTGVTDDDGRYLIAGLPPGQYDVSISASGFSTRTYENLTVTLGALVILDVILSVANVTDRISVTAADPLADSSRTAIATVVSQRQIGQLPIDGRNFISFAVITPAVSTDRTPQQGASATSGLTFAGQRARSNNITVDGLSNNDPAVGSVRASFSQEAVREFQVLTNSYTAEFGNATGGVLNIVTRSGTNRFSGDGFLFFRDDALNAKGHFEQVDPFGQPVDLEARTGNRSSAPSSGARSAATTRPSSSSRPRG